MSTYPPGTELAGRYQLQRLVGRGKAGDVYLAKSQDGSILAVRTFRQEVFGQPQLLERLLRSLQAVSQLVHPAIVGTMDFGHTEDGVPYQVMEYVEGVLMHRRLATRGPLPASESLQLLIQLAEALHAAHSAWQIHGALSSRSLMLTTSEHGERRIKVLHFGLADVTLKAASLGLYTSPGPGGVPFEPPELSQNARATPQTDIFGFGKVAFEMMTGDLAAEAAETTRRIMPTPADVGVEYTTLPAGLSASLSGLVTRCLESDPRGRPGDAGSLLKELQSMAETARKHS